MTSTRCSAYAGVSGYSRKAKEKIGTSQKFFLDHKLPCAQLPARARRSKKQEHGTFRLTLRACATRSRCRFRQSSDMAVAYGWRQGRVACAPLRDVKKI